MVRDPLVRRLRRQPARRRAASSLRRLQPEMLEDRVLLAQTTGLFFNDPGASDGFVLFSPNATDDTYLIDKQGNVVHEWNFSDSPGLLGYLQPDGSLIRAAAPNGQNGNGVIDAAGAGGRIEWVDWDGTLLWSFDYGVADTATDTRQVLQHHDFEVMPNGNILLIAWEYKTEAEAIAAGRDPATVGSEFYPDHIIEVQPDLIGGGATIVWEWHVWDHLVQDFDPLQDNYFGPTGVADNPGKIDINYRSIPSAGGSPVEDWTHANGIDYNAELDQIVLSVREFNEFWIIDHDTTTAEAAGPAGDLLYRWGNPDAYDRGGIPDRQLFFQHDAKWIPDGTPGAGNITLFNNGFFGPADPDLSAVFEIDTGVDALGNYPALAPGAPHGPAAPTWTYTGAEQDFSAIISGTQRLENGNTLITFGVDATLSEVTPDGTEVWRYVSPYVPGGMLGPEDPIPPFGFLDLRANFVFRSIHYPADFAPQFPTSVGRHLFYNNSKFDNNTPGFDPADSTAIATDKSAYLPGAGTITPANMSSYSRGINGVMVDLTGPHGALSLGDFEFHVSNQGSGAGGANNTPSTWSLAPAPTMTVLTDTPAVGTDRVAFVWPDNAIENRYLQVTVKGDDAAGGNNTNTGLSATDIFYFGNIVGDTFNDVSPVVFLTSSTDEVAVQTEVVSLAGITSPLDLDRNGVHLASDRIVARSNTVFALNKLNIASPPAAPTAPGDPVVAAIAPALALQQRSADAAFATASPDETAGAPPANFVAVRRFWRLLDDAGDARASVVLASLDSLDAQLALDLPFGVRDDDA